MPIDRELRDVISHLKSEYKHDLGIHLYSAHLMRTLMCEEAPPRTWGAWPMYAENVPRPDSSSEYVDEPEMDRRLQYSQIPPTTAAAVEVEEANENDSPDECIDVEIDRLFKRRIYTGISEIGNKTLMTEPTLDMLCTPEFITEGVKSKIDSLMDKFRNCNTQEYDSRGMYSWVDVLLESGVKDHAFLKKMNDVFVAEAEEFMNEFDSRDHHYDLTEDDTMDTLDTEDSEDSENSQNSENTQRSKHNTKLISCSLKEKRVKEATVAKRLIKLRKELAMRLLNEEMKPKE